MTRRPGHERGGDILYAQQSDDGSVVMNNHGTFAFWQWTIAVHPLPQCITGFADRLGYCYSPNVHGATLADLVTDAKHYIQSDFSSVLISLL